MQREVILSAAKKIKQKRQQINSVNYIDQRNPGLSPGFFISYLLHRHCCFFPAKYIFIKPLPVVVITNPAGVCSPATINITAPTITAGPDAGLSFSYFTDAAATTPLNNPNSISASGTYFIKGTTAAGCFSIKAVVITHNKCSK